MKLHEMLTMEGQASKHGENIIPNNYITDYLSKHNPGFLEFLVFFLGFEDIKSHDAYLIGLMAGFEMAKKHGIPDDYEEILIEE